MKCHRMQRLLTLSAMLVCGWCLSACSSLYPSASPDVGAARQADARAAPAEPAAPAAVIEEPIAPPKAPSAGELALADGVKAYRGGQYRRAELQLKAALKAGLQAPGDLSSAHKYLAFIYCTSQRSALCAAAFKNAKAADPAFALTKAEAGHPMWARTYKRALGIK